MSTYRNDRGIEDIIRSPVRASILPDQASDVPHVKNPPRRGIPGGLVPVGVEIRGGTPIR
jgi:hypothetical protein